jgi:hypothetical protein
MVKEHLGMLEYWNVGRMGLISQDPLYNTTEPIIINNLFALNPHHSIIPIFHYSNVLS